MAVRERGAGWQADVAYKGKRVREQFTTEAAARKWEALAVEALKKGKSVPDPKAEDGLYASIKSLINAVVATDWGRKPGTAPSIVYANRFAEFVGPNVHPALALTQENVDGFVTGLAKSGITGSTVNRNLSAISKLMKKAIAAGIIHRKLDLPWHSEGEARLRWYSDEEEALILQTLLLWSRPVQHDFFICLVDTGARTWKELGALKWRDVSGNPRMVTFWDTKNGDSRSVPLTSRAWEAIQRQKANGLAGPFVGVCKDDSRRLYDRLRAHMPVLQDTVWYTARHTFASRLVQRGVDLYRVQKLMGHRSIEMTMRYAKLAPTHLIDAIGVLERAAPPAPPAPPPAVNDVDPTALALARRLMAEMRREELAAQMDRLAAE